MSCFTGSVWPVSPVAVVCHVLLLVLSFGFSDRSLLMTDKESANCRLEANYAHQQELDMIPLMMSVRIFAGILLGGSFRGIYCVRCGDKIYISKRHIYGESLARHLQPSWHLTF